MQNNHPLETEKLEEQIQVNQLPRRTFIAGAMSTFGLGMLSATSSGLSNSTIGKLFPVSKETISIGYWDGTKMIDAMNLYQGDATLATVNVQIEEIGSGTMKSLDAQFIVGGVPDPVSFLAWTAAPAGNRKTNFTQEISKQRGIKFILTTAQQGQKGQIPIFLSQDSGSGLKLKEGQYVITEGKVNWGAYAISSNSANGPVVGASDNSHPPHLSQYVVVTISRG